MTTLLQKQIDQLTTHRASEWLEVMKSGDDSHNEAFIRWISESPRHLQEFLSVVALDRELPALDFGSRFDVATVRAGISTPVSELPATGTPAQMPAPARARGWKWPATLAAGIAIAIGIAAVSTVLIRDGIPSRHTLETAAGEQRSLELADGSQVHINAQSAIRVAFDGEARDIHLLRGEALFKVAQDAARPFRVHTPDAVVQALGTEFNVYARPTGTTVAVLEGKVRVLSDKAPAPAALGAGQSATIDHNGGIARTSDASVSSAIAWRDRRLVFDRTPLEEVVREFNRYNRSTRMRLEDIPAGSRHYSGDFDADDPESLGAFLAREPDLTVEYSGGQIVIRPR